MSNGNVTPPTAPTDGTFKSIFTYTVQSAIFLTILIIGCRQNEHSKEINQKSSEVLSNQAEAKEKASITQGIQLYSSWKYLDDLAQYTGSPKDKQKAVEAKKLYDEYIAKYDDGTNK